jgi:hypothetical protein
MTDWPSTATHIPPNTLSAGARVNELAGILAAGLVRLRASRASVPVGLALPPEGSVYAVTNPGHTGS